ncbi:MAG: hypothetical protein IK093_08860, partial [Ruminiclostridium sp.]|nr:hypothetical protein [Ruminiclostridium sp.]
VFTTEAFLFPLVISLIQTALAVYAVCSVCSEPYSGASVILFCFIPAYFAGSAAFTAALICMTASRYFKERRFFRAAALILAAACFDMSALLIIPIYFIAVIPNIIISVGVSAFIAALAAIFTGAAGTVFDFLGSGKCTSAQFPVPCAVIACAAAGFAFLMYTMFRNRGNDCEKLVPVLCCGAAFSVASIFVPELFALTQMLLMMSVPVLAPDALEIGEKFIGMLFPEKKGAAQTALLIACVLAEAGVCAYLIFGDVFGASVFDSALLSGVQL